jgi:hypothetical protein
MAAIHAGTIIPVSRFDCAETEAPMLSEIANVIAQNAAMLTLIVVSGLMAFVRWSV